MFNSCICDVMEAVHEIWTALDEIAERSGLGCPARSAATHFAALSSIR